MDYFEKDEIAWQANATGKNGEKFAIYIERLETVPYDDGWLRDEPVSIFMKLKMTHQWIQR